MHASKVADVAALALMAGSINAQTLFQGISAAAKAGAGAVMGKPAGLSNSDSHKGVRDNLFAQIAIRELSRPPFLRRNVAYISD